MQRAVGERPTSLMRERAQERNRRTNSEHVELVMARIFYKQRKYAKQRSFRSLEPEPENPLEDG